MLTRLALLFFLVTLISSPIKAQTTAPVRDPQALTAIASSLKALTGGTAVNDVTLQAAASYVAGSDEETGTAALTATSRQESLLQLNLTSGSRQEVRSGLLGAWVGPDSTTHCMATFNCRTDASWFFPALTLESLSSDSTIAVTYVGLDSSKGTALVHVRAARVQWADSAVAAAEILRVGTMDIYFDPQSFLPLVLDFNEHADNNPNTDITVEIEFGNFQNMNGGLVPFHIQKLLRGSLTLDLTVTSVVLNSGVPDSEFALACVPGGQL
jgi:hypothetical protein